MLATSLSVPTVTRRHASTLGRDLAVSLGHRAWSDVPAEVRADTKALIVEAYTARLAAVRRLMRLNPSDLRTVERVVRLETGLAAAVRL